jgi:ABC-type branched-subunit amino acid transport system substrate-binding protein
MRTRWTVFFIGVLLAFPASAASNGTDVVRDLASRVGSVVGAALACRDIARSRLQVIIDKFQNVIRDASDREAERTGFAQVFDRSVTDGTNALKSGKTDCAAADRRLSDLERSLGNPASVSLANAVGPSSAAAAAAAAIAPPVAAIPVAMRPAPAAASAVHGVTDNEIRFGIVVPFSGTRKEAGRELKLGIEAAFNRQNDAGGVNGRTLKLIAADDAYDPAQTLAAMKKLYEQDQVFGYIGNVGTATAAVAIPYALEHRALFFGAYTGANVVRRDPPDRYVFNYRPSYSEETDAMVRYLVKRRRIPPRQIAVLAQQDSYGEAGFAGVAKAFRSLGLNDSAILRLTYPRNTMEVDEAVNQLKLQKAPMKAVIIASTDRAAAKFIEKTRDAFPGLLYGNVSAVGATSLAGELMLLGPRFTNGVIVTQIVPAVAGHSSIVLEYKNAIAKYAPGEQPNYTSLEGYVSASILIEALKRTGQQIDPEKLVDNLEAMNNFDLGLGATLSFSRGKHQASHKIWGTALDEAGIFQPIELE